MEPPVLKKCCWKSFLCLLLGTGVTAAEDFGTARLLPVGGTVPGSHSAVELDLKTPEMPADAKCAYTAEATNGVYSQTVKLFPGVNRITAKTADGASETLARLDVQKPNLRVELSWIGQNTEYALCVNDQSCENSADSGKEAVSVHQAAAGLYRIYVRYTPPVFSGGGGALIPMTNWFLDIGDRSVMMYSNKHDSAYTFFPGWHCEKYFYSWPEDLIAKPTAWRDDSIMTWCLAEWDGTDFLKIDLIPSPYSKTSWLGGLYYTRDDADAPFVTIYGHTGAENNEGQMESLAVNATTASIAQKVWYARSSSSASGSGGVVPLVAALQEATLSVYVDDRFIHTETLSVGTVSSAEERVWNIGTVVLHSGSGVGGYAVDGRRLDVTEQGAFVGVSPQTDFEVSELSGANGTAPVCLGVGDAAQFTASGTLNAGTGGEQTDMEIIECFTNSNDAVGTVDGLGVFVAKAPGHTQVSCAGYAGDPIDVYVLKVDLVPNYDRDDDIDAADESKADSGEAFRFWVNDDDDSGEDGGDDIPGDGSADSANSKVDGVRDLPDFFPVWVDIKDTLAVLSPTEFDYVLKHADGALNAFACNSLPSSNNQDLKPNAFLYSINFGSTYGTFEVEQVTAAGLALPSGFLSEILNNNRGIILLEGRTATTAPLVLEVRRKSDSVVVIKNELPLKLSSVEDMYRWINLRPDGGRPTSTDEPANNPDALSNGKNVFFLHGFNVTADAARGWNAEIFKRLYWSGNKAKFWGMTWEGDVGLINALHYQEDVANALAVASNFNAQVSGISGDKIVLAHSLGNMVVSGAIQDYGLSVNKYFMLNAAVATECYRPASFSDTTEGNYMFHEDWMGYSNKTWCSKWFELFSSTDDRAKLTWKGRFPAVMAVAYNFYSSGDEIFEMHDDPGLFTGGLWYLERYAWQKQEMFKGQTVLGVPVPGGTSWAGWGFSGEYTMAEANAATPDNLRTNAVFRQEPAAMFSSNITVQVRNDIIAQGVPALSYAAGENAINLTGFYNYNMDETVHKPNGWGRDDDTYHTRWLHGDLKKMAYLYTYELFNELVSQGDLQ